MTTIIGIYSPRGVVMAADLQTTIGQEYKQRARKIVSDPKGNFVLATAGTKDSERKGLVDAILSGKIDLMERTELAKKHHEERAHGADIREQPLEMPELVEMTLRRTGGKIVTDNDVNGLLVATRYDGKPELYTCWPLGRIEPRFIRPEFQAGIGSGSQFALNYLAAKRTIDEVERGKDFWKRGGLTVNQLYTRAINALGVSTGTDLYSNGFDLSLVFPEGIADCYEVFNFGSIDEARERVKKSAERVKSKKQDN